MIRSSAIRAAAVLIAGLAAASSQAQNAPMVVAEARAPAAGGVLASGQYSEDPDLRCDILEVKRVSGGALNIRWRVVNTTGQPGGLSGGSGKSIAYRFSWSQLYFTDPAENKKYQFLTDAAGNRILDIYEGNYDSGKQRLNWAKFPAPPASSNKISIFIPKFPPFEDVPVSQ